MAALPLMPKATAVWLVENTALTFEQIADFSGLHKLEVQAIADGEVAVGIVGLDSVVSGQLSQEEIKRCEADPRARLKMTKSDLPHPITRTKGARYTPVSKRGEKPDAIAYLIKNFPELLDAQIGRLLGTTKETIAKVRDRSHWNTSNIKPQSPIFLGLCKQSDLDSAVRRAQRRIAREQSGHKATEAEDMAEDNASPPEDTFTDTSSQGSQSEPLEENKQSGDEQPEIDHDAMERSLG